jgi:hypothetical protein
MIPARPNKVLAYRTYLLNLLNILNLLKIIKSFTLRKKQEEGEEMQKQHILCTWTLCGTGVSCKYLHGPHSGQEVGSLYDELSSGHREAGDISALVVVSDSQGFWCISGNRRLMDLKKYQADVLHTVRVPCSFLLFLLLRLHLSS